MTPERKSPERKSQARSQRISDIPVSEPEPINPLGQHLPFPMNVNAPQEASPPHQYLTFEKASPDPDRRRATLPNLLADAEDQAPRGRKQHLEVWHERSESEHIASPEIGIALSGPPHEQSIKSKRRSRSADALRELAKDQPFGERRRSAEIRFWRGSYASESVRSDQMQRPQTARTVDTLLTANTKEVDTKSRERPVDFTPIVCQPQAPAHSEEADPIQLPVEAFNFGDLKSGFSDDDSESIQPAATITSRPNSHSQVQSEEKRLSIEDRIKHLEEGLRLLGNSVHRASGRSNRQTIVLESAPKGRRNSRNRSSSGASVDRQESHHSSSNRSRSGTRTSRTRHSDHETQQAPASPTLAAAPLSAVTEDVPSSTTTLQPAQPATDFQPTASQYNALLAHLNSLQVTLSHERQSRKTLESQISTLQRELANLNTLVNRLVHSSPNYPTPSPDAIIAIGGGGGGGGDGNGNEERMQTPKARGRAFQTSAVSSDLGYGGSVTSTSSRNSSTEDVGASPVETWATPLEGGFALGGGRGGANGRNDDMF